MLQLKFKHALLGVGLAALTFSCQEKPTEIPAIANDGAVLQRIQIGQDVFEYEEYADGTKVVEGDIVIPDAFIEKLEKLAENPDAKIEDLMEWDGQGGPASMARGEGTGDPFDSPYGSTVYYYINSDIPNKSRITNAINEWDNRTSLSFSQLSSPGSSTSSNWIRFQRGSVCSSTIPGFQTLNTVTVADGCTENNMKHEIGHSLGLFHEHQRVDRDTEIEVFWSLIPYEDRNQYRLTNTLIFSYAAGSGFNTFVEGNLDFNSIMIYNSNGKMVDNNNQAWQKNNTITNTDVATINRIINDDFDDKFVFAPYNVKVTKSGNYNFNMSWSHVGGANEFWIFYQASGDDGEWRFYKKVSGSGSGSHSFTETSIGRTPRFRLAAASNTGAFSPTQEAAYDFTGNCSCSDDAEIETVYYGPTGNSNTLVYEVSWAETPSGYSTVEFGYTTDTGTRVVLKDDFYTCEEGTGTYVLPHFNLSNGPDRFWIRAKNSGSYRYCNGSFRSRYYRAL
ncbi:MAG TPA: hypothetical protein DCE41_09940 [Cytophagales bacterium]|nr:hypothetical protein [Cytophagales bacterium]HAP63891.1 hypothetical protein [Cytophagales bacterium]